MKFLWKWDLILYFLKSKRVNIVVLNMVLIIKNIFVEVIVDVLKKVKINVIINKIIKEYMILFLMILNVEVCFVCIIDELVFLVVVFVLIKVFWKFFFENFVIWL